MLLQVVKLARHNKLVAMHNNKTSAVDNQWAQVVRNGEEKSVPAEELVVGDVVRMGPGQLVPADIRIVECHGLEFDRSTLSGECERVAGSVSATDAKYARSANMAFMSTLVMSGEGRGLVVAKGDKTLLGRFNEMSNQIASKSVNLDEELQIFANVVIVFSLIMSVLTVVWSLTFNRIMFPQWLSFNCMYY
jgi:sodium/potassium-transporting ATPase subunit alpha